MIVKMRKVYVAVRSQDRHRLLETLRNLGMVHILPVDPHRTATDEKTMAQIKDLERALQILDTVYPAGNPPDLPLIEAAENVLDIQRHNAERQNQLAKLHHQLEQQRLWGNVKLDQLQQLQAVGVEPRFYSIPREQTGEIQAECGQELHPLPGRRVLVAVIDRHKEPIVPEEARHITPPQQDTPAIRAEAAEIDQAMQQDARQLAELANLRDALRTELNRLRDQLDYNLALRNAADREHIFALQGWIPAEQADTLRENLSRQGISAAVQDQPPDENEQPPTLVRYPKWTRPIEGLFKILGTVAGYHEFDLSIPFMLALPIFTAMLISDGGYGAVLFFLPLAFYKKASRTFGTHFTHLLMIIGAVTMIWGVICATFFGKVLYDPLIPVGLSDYSLTLMMKISFYMGAVHLSIAQFWKAISFFPDLRFLNKVGWGIFTWGMLGVVQMFVLQTPFDWQTPWPYLLIIGAALAILFASPRKNLLKMLGLGVADFPLSMLSTFSDVISYVRLMAVGLASSVLAANFNQMAAPAPLPLAILILVLGHGLNIGLGLIALFAHGVRLNMLEFSNTLGMQWIGYPYKPFLKRATQEN